MRILGVDTATSTASVALIEDGRLVAEEVHSSRGSANQSQTVNSRVNHAEIILPLIEAALRKAAASLRDLSGFVVSIGLGSFTGLRIGLSTVKGLAYGLDIPVVGISTLLAGLICSFLDARKKEIYAALFRRNGDALTRLTEDRVAGASEVIELAEELAGAASCLFIGDGSTSYEKLLMDALGNRALWRADDSYPSLASAVARLSETRFQETQEVNLGSLVPVYLRSSEAEFRIKNLT
ncbi:MAG: tRNA (adenosine(37)-N6)-threonylcarbamoyltransferase complex dimerization subunit type 1 TsaB [Deltaproteobacteria bacterium 13_1_40CM_4_54_4]|nr:MAG: tRNA (adenosine(37)-N6)-threonylcarbamoyltransferase complex dimerization subunit type 1 TsaB [Deltaproteobacteria bacterium 13_1_40CM_4_54_4]